MYVFLCVSSNLEKLILEGFSWPYCSQCMRLPCFTDLQTLQKLELPLHGPDDAYDAAFFFQFDHICILSPCVVKSHAWRHYIRSTFSNFITSVESIQLLLQEAILSGGKKTSYLNCGGGTGLNWWANWGDYWNWHWPENAESIVKCGIDPYDRCWWSEEAHCASPDEWRAMWAAMTQWEDVFLQRGTKSAVHKGFVKF